MRKVLTSVEGSVASLPSRQQTAVVMDVDRARGFIRVRPDDGTPDALSPQWLVNDWVALRTGQVVECLITEARAELAAWSEAVHASGGAARIATRVRLVA